MCKNILVLGFFVLALAFVQCSNNDASSLATDVNTPDTVGNDVSDVGKTMTFKGKIKGAGGLKAYFDVKKINAAEMMTNTTIEGDGSFSFTVDDVKSGIYRIRIGKKHILLVLDGTETEVDITADLGTVESLNYDIKGSKSNREYNRIVRQFIQNDPDEGDFMNYIDTTFSPMAGYALATEILNPIRFQFSFSSPEKIIEIHSRANSKLAEAYPKSDLIPIHQSFIEEIKMVLGQQMVRMGATPPDIQLPSPSGKTYALSELKGKVVLLDFWASWCRPCRMNNPELVRIYNKYKNQGFTVYSVSLDRNAQAWKQAIIKDGLEWDYHVSDLLYWQSAPAQMYNVTGIPFTYLLDKNGKIAAINPRVLAVGASRSKAVISYWYFNSIKKRYVSL